MKGLGQFIVAAHKAIGVERAGEAPWSRTIQHLRSIYAMELQDTVKSISGDYSHHVRLVWGDLLDKLKGAHQELEEATIGFREQALAEYSSDVRRLIDEHIDRMVKLTDLFVEDDVHRVALQNAIEKRLFARLPVNYQGISRGMRLFWQEDILHKRLVEALGGVHVPAARRQELYALSFLKVNPHVLQGLIDFAKIIGGADNLTKFHVHSATGESLEMRAFLTREEFDDLVETVYGPQDLEKEKLRDDPRI
jgi:hypothetical protein